MGLRMGGMERALAYGTPACGFEDAMLGTFIPENRSEPGVFASTEFTPEIAEEEERVTQNDCLRMWCPLENMWIEDEGEFVPFFPKLPAGMSIAEALAKIITSSPEYAVVVYEKAQREKRTEISALLPIVVDWLVKTGRCSRQAFTETRHKTQRGSWSCLQLLKGYACEELQRQRSGDSHERGVAIGVMAALGVQLD